MSLSYSVGEDDGDGNDVNDEGGDNEHCRKTGVRCGVPGDVDCNDSVDD